MNLKLTRAQLIHILAQQLTMSWRHYPKTRDQCEKRIQHYLLDTIESNMKYLDRLQHQFNEVPKELDKLDRMREEIWAKARLSGPRFADTAEAIVDEHFPELKPKRKKKKP
jgi:hypothetical protein